MRRTVFPVSVAAILLASCSPAAYKVNPPPVAVEESTPVTSAEGTSSTTWRDELKKPVVEEEPEIVKEIPESQKDGYMRIVGDLRWDQLTSSAEWLNKLPQCLKKNIYPDGSYMVVGQREDGGKTWRSTKRCNNLNPGGIPVAIIHLGLAKNSGTDSKTMTSYVHFMFFDDSQSRAFKAALAQKYNFTTDGYCSQYTCWDLNNVDESGSIEATPTPYTVSLLDQVQLNTSDL